MNNNIIKLTNKLVSIESIDAKKEKLNEIVDFVMRELKGFTIERFNQNNRPSLLAYVGNKRPEKFKVILNAHLDVVAGRPDQFCVVEKGGKLWGRGVYDMKAAAAVEILVFKELASKLPYPLGLQLVTDEEMGGTDGTRFQIDAGVRAEFTIAGEGTNFGIKNEAKGILCATITIPGKAAHAAYLWKGENAVEKANKLISLFMKKFPHPHDPVWKTTLNIAMINTTNNTFNKVPDECKIGIDVRFIPKDADKILDTIQNLLPPDASMEIHENEPAQFTTENNVYIAALQKAILTVTHNPTSILQGYGASDIRHFNRVGNDGIELGPIGGDLHSDNEWVDIYSLDTYYSIFTTFLNGLKKD